MSIQPREMTVPALLGALERSSLNFPRMGSCVPQEDGMLDTPSSWVVFQTAEQSNFWTGTAFSNPTSFLLLLHS